jgi:tetratricopeptide (TPR) repeat protein
LDGAMNLYKQSLKIMEDLGDLEEKSATLHEMAWIYFNWSDLDGAMKLYQQSLEISEKIGNLKAKSDTLGDMGNILYDRGDLDGAIKLIEQSLEIKEGIGDLRGKSLGLAMLGKLLTDKKEHRRAIMAFVESIQNLSSIDARADKQMVTESIVIVRQKIGIEYFDPVWKEITKSPLPEWLSQSPQQEQGLTAEQFITGALQSAREKRPEAEKFFYSAQKIAADSSAPAEARELGRVLSRIMAGDTKVDLSGLPAKLADAVRNAIK